jgi:hypothetical protein
MPAPGGGRGGSVELLVRLKSRRASPRYGEGRIASDSDEQGLERALGEYASELRRYGDEVLRGDFSIFA